MYIESLATGGGVCLCSEDDVSALEVAVDDAERVQVLKSQHHARHLTSGSHSALFLSLREAHSPEGAFEPSGRSRSIRVWLASREVSCGVRGWLT